jgi:spore coat protein SA
MLLAHIAQEDCRLPASPRSVGSLTRVVHELSLRIARRWPLLLVSTRFDGDPAEELVDGILHRRFAAGADQTAAATWFRWRNRLARRLGWREQAHAASTLYHRSWIGRIARHLDMVEPALVHLHNVSQFVPPLHRAVPDARLVLHMHCGWLAELPGDVVARRLVGVDLVLGVSEHVADGIRRAVPALADRTAVLPNGVALDAFPPRDRVRRERADAVAALRARFRLGSPVVLYVGRLSSEKGVHVLLEAFTRLRARHPRATCVLVGPDWGPLRRVRPIAADPDAERLAALDRAYVTHLRRLAAPHGDAVVFAGPVPQHELPLYHAAADVLAAPSLEEAFGIPVLEAGATGLPVVVAATGGLRETVDAGRSGLVVPADDPAGLAAALDAVVSDASLARALAAAARARVEGRYTWDRVADRLATLYDALLTRPAAGRAA